jgi:hypothetical protein
MKEQFPGFKKGQIFETIKSIYPKSTIDKKKKNIKYNGRVFTKPLALSKKDKNLLVKESSDLLSFFNDITRGDFLQIIETDGKKAVCKNLSFRENIREAFYNDKESFVTISYDDLAMGNVKMFRRKIDKYLKGE